MSQTVCDKIAQLSSDDMNQKLLQASGLQKNIHISVDTRYNTSGIRNSRRTGLPIATQSTTLAMEKQTGKNYSVSAFTQNKLCPKGALLRSKGDQTATCPGGHTGCIANVHKLEILSEYESGCEIGRNIAGAGITVTYCTTDGDSRLHKGVAQSIQEANPSPQVKCLTDLLHLSQTQVKRAKKKTFSPHLFPGMTTEKDRQECKCVLAADLKNSSMILKHMSEKFNADT
ncbi:hypothetical protein, partial [Thiolapillus sp.]|uniref:hypothetical protein n=1 Tax=Thiolapillus sp. TaxID=2017437 RepID=UPI003AF54471